jgi:hypothetical protein
MVIVSDYLKATERGVAIFTKTFMNNLAQQAAKNESN